MSIYNIISSLEATASRNAKIEILNKNKTNVLFRRVVELALDPLTNFYIKKIPKYRSGIPTLGLDEGLSELSKLSTRKVTGNAGIDHLRNILASLDELDANVIERVIQKDLKCGVAAGVVNAAWGKNSIKEYPCMLASGYDEKLINKVKFPAYVQLKLDGMRFNAIVDTTDSSVEYRSRNGKEIVFKNPSLDEQLVQIANKLGLNSVVLDGELLVVTESGTLQDRQTGNGILNKAIKGTITSSESALIRATLWDAIPLSDFSTDVYKVPYSERIIGLHKAIKETKPSVVSLVETFEAKTIDQAWNKFNEYLEKGQEGIILKTKDGIWENKRSKAQIKFKAELDCDLVVTGYEEGTGKYQGQLGALICESADGLLKVNVGSGFTDEQRKELTPKNTVGKIAAVRYNSVIKSKTGDNSLFLPRIIEIRLDKDKADLLKNIK